MTTTQGVFPCTDGVTACTPIALPAKLFASAGRMPVLLLEMTGDAAVASTAAPPVAGSIVVLSRNGIREPATVSWVDGGRFGLMLEEPIHHRRREQLLGTSRRSIDVRRSSDDAFSMAA